MSALFTVSAMAIAMAAAMAAPAPSDDVIETEGGKLAVHAYHHASLSLRWRDKLVLVDPAPSLLAPKDADPRPPFAGLRPDLVLITHGHFDHFNVEVLEDVTAKGAAIVAPQAVFDKMPADLQAKTKVMANGDEAEIIGLKIEAVPAYNLAPERLKYHPKGVGNGYVIGFGETRVYVAGDTEETPEIAHLPNIAAAFLPMNLPYTQTVEAAAKWVRDFKPRIVYPYHFGLPDGGMSDLDKFKADVGDASTVKVLKWY